MPPQPDPKAISDSVYVFPSPPDAKPAKPTDPTSILIHGWGGATAKQLRRHIAGHRALFPAAKIVVVISAPRLYLLRSYKDCMQAMAKAIDEIFSASPQSTAAHERLLVHVLSNSGLYFYSALLNAYAQRSPGPGASLPHDLLVLDSAPGGAAFRDNVGRWTRATAAGLARSAPVLPSPMLQACCGVFWAGNRAVEVAAGRENMHAVGPRVVNDPGMEAVGASRVYLYSRADEVVGWRDVERHAVEAEAKGYRVLERVVFEGSRHVEHMRADGERYWGAVRRAWETAVAAGGGGGEEVKMKFKARL